MSDDSTKLAERIYHLAIDDEGRSCRDISDAACDVQAGSFGRHVGSLSLSKIADGLIDPKLVLSWLLSNLGASSTLIGLLVPIREAGALLPQLFTAGALRSLPKRKWAWSVGAVLQGLSALAIVIAAVWLPSSLAPFAIIIALTVLALARSVCSVCYKDVLGKTIAKSRRGTATGLATSLSGGAIILFSLLLISGLIERKTLVLSAISFAGIAFIVAACLFATLKEAAGATDGGRSAIKDTIANFGYLKTDPQLRRFITVRGLLTATALAPPFIVALANQDGLLQTLGFFILASALASLVSGWVWGRLADRSSRKVLIYTGVISAIILGFTASLPSFETVVSSTLSFPAALFVLMLAYQGVRLGRSTHLVDMADEKTRAAYTALSNTIIGVILLFGAVFGVIAKATSTETVLIIMSVMCAIAALSAMKLDEVQAS